MGRTIKDNSKKERVAKFHLRGPAPGGGSYHTCNAAELPFLQAMGYKLVRVSSILLPPCFEPAEGVELMVLEELDPPAGERGAVSLRVVVALLVGLAMAGSLALATMGGAGEVGQLDGGGSGSSSSSSSSTSTTEVPAEPEVRTSSATLVYGSQEHVRQAYGLHLAAHAVATAAYEADPYGQDYADALAVFELRTAEYLAAVDAGEAGR